MLKARDELEEAVDSSGEAEPILTKDPSPAAVMEVEESSSNEDVVAVDFKTTSKKGAKPFTSPKRKYSRSKTEAGTTKTPTKKPARMEVEQSSSDGYGSDTSFSDAVKTKKTKRDSTTSTPKRKRCPPKKGKGTPKNKKVKDSNVDDEAKDAKKAALAGLKAKSQGKDRENFENSMRIFSHLDSNKMTTGRPEGGSYDSPSWPSVYSSSSATAYHTSSLSPGMSDAGTSLPPSPPCGSASPSFPPFSGDPGFSWYLQEQRRTPFMPVPPRLSSSYSYPPAVHCGMQQDIPNIGQLTTCLYKLMGEVRTIKNDLKRAKKKNPGFLSDRQDSLESDSSMVSLSPSPAPSHASCILGDHNGEHVRIDGFTQRQVKGKEVLASSASSLALKLMDLFFTKEEMGKSNCTPAEGREILRQDIIAGIRCHVNHMYPADDSATRWKEILHKKMNSKCRNHRALFKKEE